MYSWPRDITVGCGHRCKSLFSVREHISDHIQQVRLTWNCPLTAVKHCSSVFCWDTLKIKMNSVRTCLQVAHFMEKLSPTQSFIGFTKWVCCYIGSGAVHRRKWSARLEVHSCCIKNIQFILGRKSFSGSSWWPVFRCRLWTATSRLYVCLGTFVGCHFLSSLYIYLNFPQYRKRKGKNRQDFSRYTNNQNQKQIYYQEGFNTNEECVLVDKVPNAIFKKKQDFWVWVWRYRTFLLSQLNASAYKIAYTYIYIWIFPFCCGIS